ncbi:MAG: TIGR00701 family protein [Deltaproteobacteria bacterium]|nr:TIGR00701 family protein [Deltaproteobacteria bacterium]
MSGFLISIYPWIKVLHVLAVISWMAGLLYLPRLFVNHAQVEVGSETSEVFKGMEDRLARLIMRPAMIVSVGAGLAMISIPGTPGYLPHAGYWLWAKLLFVAVLLFIHFQQLRWRDDFMADRNQREHRFYRIMNEVPTLLMIGIVIFVIVKPF